MKSDLEYNELLDVANAHAQIRAVHLSLKPWTIEQGLITPTLEVKRERVSHNFGFDKIRVQLFTG
jgi:long-subunit acyl-CoA synthetase (AMP-forming)